MKNNNKGFTLIEMLAAVVILGILGSIAIAGVTKYLTDSRRKAYNMMSQSIYEAAENGATQGTYLFPTIENKYLNIGVEQLVSDGYLDALKNPIKSKPDCTGSITITAGKPNSLGSNIKYTYKVALNCIGVANETITWPKETSNIILPNNLNSNSFTASSNLTNTFVYTKTASNTLSPQINFSEQLNVDRNYCYDGKLYIYDGKDFIDASSIVRIYAKSESYGTGGTIKACTITIDFPNTNSQEGILLYKFPDYNTYKSFYANTGITIKNK